VVEQEILMISQELQGMLAILENYDGNDASSFVTVAQRLHRLFDMIEERYNGDIQFLSFQ
jgi:hypothetical protein